MSARRGEGRGSWILSAVLLVAAAWAGAGCGATASGPEAPSPGATTVTPAAHTTPAAYATPTAIRTDRPNPPSAEVLAVLEGRIAAMNKGDGWAAARFYTERGVLQETDLTPHLFSVGREELALRFQELYFMGLRLAPAGTPIANDRYVAEPTRFYNGNGPGRGAAMLVFEIGPGNKLADQWMIGWAGGPERTFSVVKSPSENRPNLPPARIQRMLEERMAAVNRGDGRAAAASYAKDAKLEELGRSRSDTVVTRGRSAIAARLEGLSRAGLRLAAAGAPIAYDAYVAEPVRFFNGSGQGRGAGMIVMQFDPSYRIVHEWVIGWTSDAADQSTSAWPGPVADTILYVKGSLSGSDNLISEEGIYTIHSDGTDLTRLVSGTEVRSPAWSPDGSRIAYIQNNAVLVMDADGSDRRTLSPANWEGGGARWLSWSPDGAAIAYSSGGLYVVNADGPPRAKPVLEYPAAEIVHPAWSPDGRIYFGKSGATGRIQIWSVDADGGRPRVVKAASSLGTFSLSGDGRNLLLASGDTGRIVGLSLSSDPPRRTVLVDDATSLVEPVTFFSPAASWSPDGKSIVVAADQDPWIAPAALFVIDGEGRAKKLRAAGVGWNPVWRPE